MEQPRYSEEDARRILQDALEHQNDETEFSREQLMEMADELGIAKESVLAAEKKLLSKQNVEQERLMFERQRRQKFRTQLMSYGIVITFLFFINLLTSPSHWWFLYPLLGWGMAIAFQAWEISQTEGEKYEKEFEKWRVKRQIEDKTKRLPG